MSIPTTMKATVVENGVPTVKSGIPLPHLEDGYLLLKTKAMAGNPTDWKSAQYGWCPNGALSGCDVAGEIVKMGKDVDTDKFHIGDNVYGFIHGSSFRTPDNGAFAEYSAVDSKLSFTLEQDLSGADSIPAGVVDSLEAGATIPCSWLTAGATLFYHMKLNMEWEPKEVQRKGTVLIWGGATALGQALLELFQHFNAFERVVVVASKKHEERLKNFGVTELFDYHDEDVIDQIKNKYKDISWLVDCVSTIETHNQTYQCAPSDIKSTVFNYMALGTDTIKPELRRENVTVDFTVIYKALGFDIKLGDMPQITAEPEYRESVVEFCSFINPYFKSGSLHHIPIKIYKNGLESTIQIMKDLNSGKNSGEKLVAVFP